MGYTKNWNSIHHEEIARSIVNDVAISLEEYGKAKGYNLTKQFNEAMAWGGLKENDVKDWVNLPDEKKKEIIALANKENAYLTKNAPCP